MTTAERIDAILKTKNWSRRRLAKEAGIPPSTLQSAMERGGDKMSVDMVAKLSVALGVDPLILYGGTFVGYLSDFQTLYPGERWLPVTEESLLEQFRKLNAHGRKIAAERVDELAGIDWKVTYKTVTGSRFDAKAFRKDHSAMAEKYTRQTTTRRLTIA